MLKRKHDSHKGQNGKVLVVGGSEEYVGAPALCALAALRTGADLATIMSPEKTAFAINSLSPDLITVKLSGRTLQPSHYPEVIKQAEKADVVVIGPGLGQSKRASEAVKKVCEKIDAPKVIDADALKALEEVPENCVLTPHAKEFEALFNEKPTRQKVRENAGKNKVIVLKGFTDLISDGLDVKENHTGNSGMTVGGTGDVLAGVIAGLIAQKTPLMEAALLGTEINGKAGDLLFEKYGYSFTASDLLAVIPNFVYNL